MSDRQYQAIAKVSARGAIVIERFLDDGRIFELDLVNLQEFFDRRCYSQFRKAIDTQKSPYDFHQNNVRDKYPSGRAKEI